MGSDERRLDLRTSATSAKRITLMLGLVFAVGLAVAVGSRMSAEAMAVVVGVVCGIAAGIPTSVLLLAVMSRRDQHRNQAWRQQRQVGDYPPVVVIQGGSPQALSPGQQAGTWPSPPPQFQAPRQFQVVGSEEMLGEWRT